MFWLIWQMGILLLLAIAAGVAIGHQIWSGDARSAEADKALSDNAQLRQENENLARRLGEASVQSAGSRPIRCRPMHRRQSATRRPGSRATSRPRNPCRGRLHRPARTT